jgi:hypothetical protein
MHKTNNNLNLQSSREILVEFEEKLQIFISNSCKNIHLDKDALKKYY